MSSSPFLKQVTFYITNTYYLNAFFTGSRNLFLNLVYEYHAQTGRPKKIHGRGLQASGFRRLIKRSAECKASFGEKFARSVRSFIPSQEREVCLSLGCYRRFHPSSHLKTLSQLGRSQWLFPQKLSLRGKERRRMAARKIYSALFSH